MGLFLSSYRHTYILLAIDYMSKWVKAIATLTNRACVVVKFLQKNIFSKFDMPPSIVSDEGTHLYKKLFMVALEKYGIKHNTKTLVLVSIL